jgi:predicted lipoprotein with Yx(FWY)xxD motif
MRRVLVAVFVAASVAVVVAGSGLAAGTVATVKTRHDSKLGTYLVDSKGRTLYLFEKDKTTKSTCYGACAKGWPPLLSSGKPKAAGAARATLLSTTKRRNGSREVTYNGHPLYYFVADKKAGDTKGQGLNAFGAKWYVLAPSGKKIDKD